MPRLKQIFISLFAVLLSLPVTGISNIFNVPDDFETIQVAIDESENGDTVLVEPGEYVENINYSGKAITVASLILTTGDPVYIDSTIIDGNGESCVVKFENGENNNSILQGFTIRNGAAEEGGGILCDSASPVLADLLVTGNTANIYGGGVWGEFEADFTLIRSRVTANEAENGGGVAAIRSSIVLEDVIIEGNNANYSMGGFMGMSGTSQLRNVLIANNSAARYAGAGFLRSFNDNVFTNVTIVDNAAELGGSGIFLGTDDEDDGRSRLELINCIIYRNVPEQVWIGAGYEEDPGSVLTVNYSDIEGGEDEITVFEASELIWSDSNIDEDPLFIDPDNGDYHLTADSPCIDTGDPEFPNDPDGTRADMGAYFYDHREDEEIIFDTQVIDVEFPVSIAVTVCNLDNDNDLDIVGLSEGDSTLAWWENDGMRNLTKHFIADITNPMDLVITDLNEDDRNDIIVVSLARVTWYENCEFEDTLISFTEHEIADFQVGYSIYAEDIDGDDDIDILGGSFRDAGITWWENIGDGNFVDHSIFENHAGITVVKAMDFDGDGDVDIISGSAARDDSIIIWENDGDENFERITIDDDAFDIYSISVVDLDEDEDMDIIGAEGGGSGSIRWWENRGDMNFTDHLITDDFESVKSVIAVDMDSDGDLDVAGASQATNTISWWCNNGEEEFTEYNITTDYNGVSYVHAADFDLDGDIDIFGAAEQDRFLWWESYRIPPFPSLQVDELALDFGCVEIDSSRTLSLTLMNIGYGNLTIIEIFTEQGQFSTDFDASFILQPDASREIRVTFTPDYTGVFETNLVILTNDPVNDSTIIPLLGDCFNDINDDGSIIPLEFGITSSPNPFNSTTTISYSLPVATQVSLKVFDPSGREVKSLVEGYMEAGNRTVSLSGDGLASGVYLVRMEAGKKSIMRKVLLVR